MSGTENSIKGGKLLFLSIAAAMGGFLFGYDTAVINGGEQQIQSGLDPHEDAPLWETATATTRSPAVSARGASVQVQGRSKLRSIIHMELLAIYVH